MFSWEAGWGCDVMPGHTWGLWEGAESGYQVFPALVSGCLDGWVRVLCWQRLSSGLHNQIAFLECGQATGLDAWASRVKCPARFVSHLHEICRYIWVVYSLCFFCCLFITVTWWYVRCIEWASGNQEEVHACLVTLWLFIISCYSLYKTTLGLLCSWFENNPHFHKYSMDFHV